MAKNCESCKWWDEQNEERNGVCHRYPPPPHSLGIEEYENRVWCSTDDFCGEFEVKE